MIYISKTLVHYMHTQGLISTTQALANLLALLSSLSESQTTQVHPKEHTFS